MCALQFLAKQAGHFAVELLLDITPLAWRVWWREQPEVTLIDDLKADVSGINQSVDGVLAARICFDRHKPRLDGLLRNLPQDQRLSTFEVALEVMRDAAAAKQLRYRDARDADWRAGDTFSFGNLTEQTAPAVLVEADIKRDCCTVLLSDCRLDEDQLSVIKPGRQPRPHRRQELRARLYPDHPKSLLQVVLGVPPFVHSKVEDGLHCGARA